jgi:hypothetical protein
VLSLSPLTEVQIVWIDYCHFFYKLHTSKAKRRLRKQAYILDRRFAVKKLL